MHCDFNLGSSDDALFNNTLISFFWYLVCKLLAMVLLNLFTVDIAEELVSSSKLFRILCSTGSRTDNVGYLIALRYVVASSNGSKTLHKFPTASILQEIALNNGVTTPILMPGSS